MTQYTQDTVLLPILAAAAMLLGILGVCTLANGDDNPPAGATPGQRHAGCRPRHSLLNQVKCKER